MDVAVKFNSVKKTYRTKSAEIEALQSLAFEVPKGSIYGFAGPNGAGKSTALKILVGLVSPDEGSVEVFGKQGGTKEAKRLIGFLPEVTLYHEFMGAEELLAIHATLAGLDRETRAEKCEQALQKVGLIERRKSRLKEFSKGMKQRFGIAQAIVGEPKLLVLDELTSGLDPQAQASLLELLQQLRSQGLTIFFSSHHLREIEKVCDSVAIIHKGVLRASGTLDEVLGDEQRVRLKVFFKLGEEPDESSWARESDGSFVTSLRPEEAMPTLRRLEPKLERVHSLETRGTSMEELFTVLTSDSKGDLQ